MTHSLYMIVLWLLITGPAIYILGGTLIFAWRHRRHHP